MLRFTIIITLVSLCLISKSAYTQPTTFSQYDNSPLSLNPAMTGNFEGDYRLNFNFKNEHAFYSVYCRTSSFSQDTYFSINKSNKIGLGLQTQITRSDFDDLKQNHSNLFSSFIHKFDNSSNFGHSLSLGLALGLRRNSFKLSQNSTTATINPDGPSPSLDTFLINPNIGETQRGSYLTLSSGINWDYTSKSLFGFQIGAAVYNFNKPISTYSIFYSNQVPKLISLHGNLQIPLWKRVILKPSFIFNKVGAWEESIPGISAIVYLNNTQSKFLQFGIWSVYNSYVFNGTVDFRQLRLGLSFNQIRNITVTRFTKTFELSIGYRISKHQISIPTGKILK